MEMDTSEFFFRFAGNWLLGFTWAGWSRALLIRMRNANSPGLV